MHNIIADGGLPLPTEACVFDPHALYAYLQRVTDKRDPRGRRYPLAPLLAIAVLAKLVGCNSSRAVAEWAQLRHAALHQLFGLGYPHMPHPTTWNRIFGRALDPEQLTHLVYQFFQHPMDRDIPARGAVVMALDGKTLRGTIPSGQTRGVHLFAAYIPQQGVVVAQVAVDLKENEIVAAPKLVATLDLRGVVVTGDAMQTQKALSTQIVAKGGDYLWFVKDNQPSLLTDITILFEPEPLAPGASASPTDFTTARQVTKGHGRVEERRITVSGMLADYTPWPHLAQVFKLERWVTRTSGAVTYEVRYGVTSLPGSVADASRLLTVARQHWAIENNLHWRRDVLLGEDACQVRQGHAAHVWAILNNTVIALLTHHGLPNMAQARRMFAYNPAPALDFILT